MQTDLVSDSPGKHKTQQRHGKCNSMSKQQLEKGGHLSLLALKFSADKKGFLHAKYGM